MSHIINHAFNNSEFIAMLAHDMKTPIKAQIRAMNLLYSGAFGELGEEVENLIKNVIASNKYLRTIVDNVLGDYRINSGKFILNVAKNDFRKTLEEALNNIGILSEIKNQKIVINYLTDEFLAYYDEIEIQRVIINLLSNAFEYAKEQTSIKLTVDREYGKLKVKFLSSSMGNPILKSNTGLGLLICEKIITAHGGEFVEKNSLNGEYMAGFTLP